MTDPLSFYNIITFRHKKDGLVKYEGNVKKSDKFWKPQGFGKFVFENGCVIKANFNDGIPCTDNNRFFFVFYFQKIIELRGNYIFPKLKPPSVIKRSLDGVDWEEWDGFYYLKWCIDKLNYGGRKVKFVSIRKIKPNDREDRINNTTSFILNKDTDIKLYNCVRNVEKKTDFFEDVFYAITMAKEFIYFTGWSIKHNIKLCKVNGLVVTLDMLLENKIKNNKYIQIVFQIWEDPDVIPEFSKNKILTNMGTFSKETEEFFRKEFPKKLRKNVFVARSKIALEYTHHQKTIICDSFISECGVVAFIGGIDITEGRFDDQNHSLYDNCFLNYRNYNPSRDFSNTRNMLESSLIPRQPWQDIHARVDGLTAIDILKNFKQRWEKTGNLYSKKSCFLKCNLEKLKKLKIPTKKEVFWRSQIIRSIDYRSIHNFKNQAPWKEDTIHQKYLELINLSSKFIYIENQYFIGSSCKWGDILLKDISENKVPETIVKRIIQKVKNGIPDYFVVVVLPLYPEGELKNIVTQTLLFFQFSTIKYMYRELNQELKEEYEEYDPTNNLLFCCLGKVEKIPMSNNVWERNMIYVHSKLLVVDDERLILGSANINDRSMLGDRDTEICMCAFEISGNGLVMKDGKVKEFRKDLWKNHFGDFSLCIEKVKKKCTKNYKMYCEYKQLGCNGMDLPLIVKKDGSVIGLPFPGEKTVKFCGTNPLKHRKKIGFSEVLAKKATKKFIPTFHHLFGIDDVNLNEEFIKLLKKFFG